MKVSKIVIIVALLTLLSLSCAKAPRENKKISNEIIQIKGVKKWMYQIQGLDEDGAIEKLEETDYEMLVIEPTYTNKGSEDFDIKSAVKRLKKLKDGKQRLVIAYIDIGEAEDYRTYWKDSWKAHSEDKKGEPDFIVAKDPDGWEGNYPVAYWDKRWKDIWIGKNGLVKELAKYGFDGIYLDWVGAYDDERIIKVAQEQGIEPAEEMVAFIKELKAEGKRINDDFLVISQNAPYLIDEVDNYTEDIDALAMEDTWFKGDVDSGWDDSNGGDIKNDFDDDYSTDALIKQYKKYFKKDIPVFTVDYCLKDKNADFVYEESKKEGFIPLVTRVSLSRITETKLKK